MCKNDIVQNQNVRMFFVRQRETVMAGKALIGYVRVSTSQQGRSGLGLEAQKQALMLV